MKKLLVFVQENCPTCTKLKDQLNGIDLSYQLIYPSKEGLEYFKKYKILNTPTSILIDEDGEIDRFYGAKDSEQIYNFYNLY